MKIVCLKDGPIYLEGKFSYEKDGVIIELDKVALCRCGQSNNKPFCDGNHKESKFQASNLAIIS